MEIKYGIWDHFENRPHLTVEEQFREKIGLLQEAERLGYYSYHLAEHHLSSLDMAPSPNVFLAALAQATSRLHVGTMVYILPLYHPVRFVQEAAMLDQLSGGRLEIGVGRGARKVEHDWFGLDTTKARAMNEEFIKIIVSAFTSGNLKYDGEFYKIPDAPLDMFPKQRPYPPLWYAGGAETAGKAGMNFFGRGLRGVQTYWELWDETRKREDRLNPQVQSPLAGITKHVVIRESEAEATAIARRAWPVFEDHWAATSLETPDGRVVPAHSDFDEVLKEDARLLIGTPAQVRDYLEPYLEAVKDRPTFYISPAIQWGDITTEEAAETMTLFAREVVGRLQPTASK